jgi:hypothetical protein
MEKAAWYKWTFIAVLVLLVLTSCIARWRLDPVSPVADGNAANDFSAVHARKVLSDILGDQRPHPVDSAANGDVRARIVSALNELGYQAVIQDATSCRDEFFQACARVRNIIVTRPGTVAGKSILLSAHYDSVGAGPGASDDGSGVVVLLEIARLLKQRPADKNGVILLFTEGEEVGLLGAQAFASQSPMAKNIAAAINIEARGTSGQSALFETGDNSGWLVDDYVSSSRHPLTNSLLNTVYKLMPNDTDLSVFKGVGMQGLNFAYGEHFAYYHTPGDSLQSLDLGSLQQQGDNVYDLLKVLLNADLASGNANGSRIYTDVLGLGVVHWSPGVGVGMALVLLIALLLIDGRLGVRAPYSKGSVVRGFLSFPLSLIVGGAIAYVLMAILLAINGRVTPWHSDAFFNRVFLWGAVLLAVISVQRIVVRKSNPIGLWVGISLAWLLMGLITSIVLPGISYIFILVNVLLLVASLIVLLLMPRVDGRWSVLFAVPAVTAFVVMFPIVFMVEIMLGFNLVLGTVGMGIFLGLAATFLAPLVAGEGVSRTFRYTSVGTLAIVVISAVLSVHASASTKSQPVALNVMYRQGADNSAYLFSGTRFDPPSASMLQEMGRDVSLKAMHPWNDELFYAVPIKSAGLSPAKLTVLSESQAGNGREIVARIDSDEDTQSILILIPKSIGLTSIEMDGQVMDYSNNASQVGTYKVFACHGESCNGRQLKLMVSSKTPQPATVVKFAAIPQAAANLIKARNVYAIPQNGGDQSMVVNEDNL